MNLYDPTLAVVKLHHLDLTPKGVDGFQACLGSSNQRRAAYALCRMFAEAGEISRFNLQQFMDFTYATRLPWDGLGWCWEDNPSHRQGFERLVYSGFIFEVSPGVFQVTAELIDAIWASASTADQFETVTSEFYGEDSGPYRSREALDLANLSLET